MFAPTVHECSAALRGSPDWAFDLATTALLSQGFEIVHRSDTELRCQGPGMQSNQQSPLLGVSDFRLRIASSVIAVKATLGGVARMKAFLYLFPPGLALVLAASTGLFGEEFSWPVVGWAAPWLVLSPLMASSLERRTTRAVESLVRGMAQAHS